MNIFRTSTSNPLLCKLLISVSSGFSSGFYLVLSFADRHILLLPHFVGLCVCFCVLGGIATSLCLKEWPVEEHCLCRLHTSGSFSGQLVRAQALLPVHAASRPSQQEGRSWCGHEPGGFQGTLHQGWFGKATGAGAGVGWGVSGSTASRPPCRAGWIWCGPSSWSWCVPWGCLSGVIGAGAGQGTLWWSCRAGQSPWTLLPLHYQGGGRT